MPANPLSLRLTELFRQRLLVDRQRLERQAIDRWPTIDALDTTDWAAAMAGTVTQAQADAVRAASGYLNAFVRLETGRNRLDRRTANVTLNSRAYAGVSRDGRPLAEALVSPLIGVKAKLKEGATPEEALAYGLQRGTRMVSVDFDHAHRSALLEAIQADERFQGWQRAVRGTCAACLAVATGPNDSTHFEVHPSCQCVSEPVVKPDRNEFGEKAKKGDRVQARAGHELKDGEWVPVEGPLRGPIARADDAKVMINAGTPTKPRWVTVARERLAPIERAASKQQVLRAELGQSTKMFPLNERKAMLDYTGGKGSIAEELNRSLRSGTAVKHEAVKDGLDSAFARVKPLSQEGVVYRGTKVKGARQLKVGSEIQDNGFMSTSPVRAAGEDFTALSGGDLYEIVLPKGTRALDMNRAAGSRFGKEREVLLPRGTRMVVESIEPHPTRPGRRIIRVRVVL